ncbi:MAG: DMT family transporter [Mesorhizobium sp.]|nr:DMT family transporter [Mesorhizobium sp.]
MTVASAIPTSQKPMSAALWGLLLLLGAIWGGAFFFVGIAVAEIQPLTLVLLRVATAALLLQVWLRIRGLSFATVLPVAGSFFGLALLNNVVPFSLMFIGQTAIGAGLASVLNATTPFWTLIIAGLLVRDERLTFNRAAGILLGIAGTAVMIGPGLAAGIGGPVWAKFCLIGTALSYACAFTFARRLKGIEPEIVATGQLTASAIIMLPIVLLVDGVSGAAGASLSTWAAVAALASLSTAFAYIIFFNLIAKAGSTNTSLVTLIVPVSAILLGVLFLGERLELFEVGGMALIGLGLATIDGRLFNRR